MTLAIFLCCGASKNLDAPLRRTELSSYGTSDARIREAAGFHAPTYVGDHKTTGFHAPAFVRAYTTMIFTLQLTSGSTVTTSGHVLHPDSSKHVERAIEVVIKFVIAAC